MKENRNKSRVLIVDDEPNILLAIEFLLQQNGLEVKKATNGQEALGILDSFTPEIIVLDLMMPGIDGFEVAKEVRKIEKLQHTRILFLTAKGTIQDKMNGYNSGGEIYLTKPFDNSELINIINEVLEFG